MSSPQASGPTIRFGEFAVDLETRELFRNGSKIKLQGQPLESLAVLVQHPGRVVTRDDLRRRRNAARRGGRSTRWDGRLARSRQNQNAGGGQEG